MEIMGEYYAPTTSILRRKYEEEEYWFYGKERKYGNDKVKPRKRQDKINPSRRLMEI